MARRHLALLLGALVLAPLLATSPAAAAPGGGDPAVRAQPLGFAKNGYDYAPSILWDGSQWVMYHCGIATVNGYQSDNILRSTSPDGVRWSDPVVVLSPGAPGEWDDQHTCDPTVLTGIDIGGFTWAMWYTGIDSRETPTSGQNNIGLALSHDGITWEKRGIAVDCGTPDPPGCSQPSVMKVGQGYVMVHVDFHCPDAECRLNRVQLSTDAVHWTSSSAFTLPQLALGADWMHGTDGRWYAAVGGNTSCGASDADFASEMQVYAMDALGQDPTDVGCVAWPDVGSDATLFAPEGGFFRDRLGGQPADTTSIWVAFGLSHGYLHSPDEEITAAQVALVRPGTAVRRHAGVDREATAAALSRAAFLRSRTAVLARADEFADALAGGPLAAVVGGPVLLSGRDRLGDATAAELRRLGVRDVLVLGGPNALGTAVEDGLRAAGVAQVRRLAGADRFATAAAVAREVAPPGGGGSAYLASGWPDAVAVSALAAAERRPILLTSPDALPAATATALRSTATTAVTVVGGTSAVSDAVVGAVTANGQGVERVAGLDRYDTSRQIAARMVPPGGYGLASLWLATGRTFADSLVAAPAAAAAGGALLLVDPDDRSSWPAPRPGGWRTIDLVGGTSSLPPALETSAEASLAPSG